MGAHSAGFCREQEAIERNRASLASLPNVKAIATRAADVWAQEAMRAERREGKSSAARSAQRLSDDEVRMLSENPDRGLAT